MHQPSTPQRTAKRQSKTCKRCLRRKQRCHGFPVCTNCEDAGQPCEQSELALQLHRHSSGYAALKRIQSLEAQVERAQREIFELRQEKPMVATSVASNGLSSQGINQYRRSVFHSGTVGGLNNFDPSRERQHPGETPDQCPPTKESIEHHQAEPMGETDLEHIVQATVWTKALSPTLGKDQTVTAHLGQLRTRCAAPPSDEAGLRILNAYFDRIYPRYPFFDRQEIYELHFRRNKVSDSNPVERFGTFKLFMLYAIGATMLQLTEPYDGEQPDRFFVAALQHISAARQSHTVHNIQAMTLLVLYNLRAPSNSGIWYMIGLAIRTCIDLGMHRELHYASLPPEESHLRRRLFWSVYLLERGIALSLGRPFSVSDRDIDVTSPMVFEKAIDTADGLDAQQILFWIHYVEGKRFESRIYTEVSRLDESQEIILGKISPLLTSLDAWRQSVPRLSPSQNDHLDLQWNKASLLLIRPFLSRLGQDDPLIRRCLVASGQLCEIFKRFHQRDSYGHSFISAHTVFIAGVTICYCLFRSMSLFSMTVANNLRACSSTMFVMAERTPSIKKHRDVLESTIGRALDSVCNSDPLGSLSRDGDSNSVNNRNLSPHDLLAVQSLMGLSAQQDPSGLSAPEVSPDGNGSPIEAVQSLPTPDLSYDRVPRSIDKDGALDSDFNGLVVPARLGFSSELPPELYGMDATNSCQDYSYSIQMLHEMMVLDALPGSKEAL